MNYLEDEDENRNNVVITTKYFFVSMKFYWNDGYNGEPRKLYSQDVFKLDHYPSRKEIIYIMEGNSYERFELLSYNELTKEAYDAYKKDD